MSLMVFLMVFILLQYLKWICIFSTSFRWINRTSNHFKQILNYKWHRNQFLWDLNSSCCFSSVDADREIAISPFVFRLPAHLPPFRPLKHRKVLLFSLSVLKVFVPLIWTKKTENQVWYNETQTRPRCEEVLPLCPFDDPRMVINILSPR